MPEYLSQLNLIVQRISFISGLVRWLLTFIICNQIVIHFYLIQSIKIPCT